jgi:hypothetical protein
VIDVALVHFETITVPYLRYLTVSVVPGTVPLYSIFLRTVRTGTGTTLSFTKRGNRTDILIVLFFLIEGRRI